MRYRSARIQNAVHVIGIGLAVPASVTLCVLGNAERVGMAHQKQAIRGKGLAKLCLLAVTALGVIGSTITGSYGAVAGKAPKRVVSINACTDQLVFALADRAQISALTNYGGNPAFSLHPEKIEKSGIKLIRGAAEEVMKLQPDLVLAGRFTRAATRQRLKDFGIRLETFAPAASIEDAKRDIRRVGTLLGQRKRADVLIAAIDTAFDKAREGIGHRGLRLLQIHRQAYISGEGTLFDDILDKLGLANAGREFGIRGARRSSLEAVLKLRPDVLIMLDKFERAEDQGAALLSHPALKSLYPLSRRIVIPGNQTVCGGPSLPLLLHSIANGIAKLDMAAVK